MFNTELREVRVSGCRVGFKVEAVSRFNWCGDRNGDLRRALVEVAAELVS